MAKEREGNPTGGQRILRGAPGLASERGKTAALLRQHRQKSRQGNLDGEFAAGVRVATLHQFHPPRRGAPTHHQAPGHADQIGILELHAGALGAIIQQDIHSG